MKCRKNRGRKARSRTKLTEGTGLGVHHGVPCHAYLPLGSTPGHLDYLQVVPQVLDFDRGSQEATARQVALPL